MSQQRLTEVRVHELITNYATNNGGATPSATQILELNEQFGSLQSATRYRKSYLEKQPAVAQDPFAGFPSAIADAAKEMQVSLKAEAQREIEIIKVAADEEIKALQKQLEGIQDQLVAQSDTESELRSKLSETAVERDSLIDETRALRALLESVTTAHTKTQSELSVERERSKLLAQQVDGLSTITSSMESRFETQNTLLKGLQNSSQTLTSETKELSSTQLAANQSLTNQLDRITRILNDDRQSIDRLTQTNHEIAVNAEKHAKQYHSEITQHQQTIERLQNQLEAQQKESHRAAELETAKKVDTSIDHLKQLTAKVAKLYELIPPNDNAGEELAGDESRP